MYSRQHLISMGFKKSSLEYAAVKGFMEDATRVYPGGPRLLSAIQVLKLADKINVQLSEHTIKMLKDSIQKAGSEEGTNE